MILLLLAVAFGVLYVISRRSDVRRLRNGVFVMAAVGCLLLAVATEAVRASPDLETLVYVGGLGGLCLVGIFAIFLVANGVTMIRTEGRSLGNLLSLVVGVAIIVVPAAAVVLALEIAPGGLPSWVRVVLTALGILLVFACLYAAASFMAFGAYSIIYSRYRHNPAPAAVVVLGSGLIHGEVPPLLRSRLDKALAIYRSIPEGATRPILIPSGGQGSDESRPEGEAMAEYLLAHGALPTDVHPETCSRTTRENLLFSREIQRTAGYAGSTLVVTSSYHVLRAALLARSIESDAQVIGSATAAYYVPSAFLREYIAIMVEHKRLNGAAAVGAAAIVAVGALWSLLPV